MSNGRKMRCANSVMRGIHRHGSLFDEDLPYLTLFVMSMQIAMVSQICKPMPILAKRPLELWAHPRTRFLASKDQIQAGEIMKCITHLLIVLCAGVAAVSASSCPNTAQVP
jgi:hypothetical protein